MLVVEVAMEIALEELEELEELGELEGQEELEEDPLMVTDKTPRTSTGRPKIRWTKPRGPKLGLSPFPSIYIYITNGPKVEEKLSLLHPRLPSSNRANPLLRICRPHPKMGEAATRPESSPPAEQHGRARHRSGRLHVPAVTWRVGGVGRRCPRCWEWREFHGWCRRRRWGRGGIETWV